MYIDLAATRGGKKPRDIKKHNTNLVISLFRRLNEATMTEISEKTSLSKTTISKIFSRLSENGIIVPTGRGNSTAEGGKRPVVFSLYPDYCYSIMLSAGFADHITCIVSDLAGQTPYRNRTVTDPDITYEDTLMLISQKVVDAIETLRIPHDKLCGIAILYDGIIDSVNGIIINSAHRPWPSNLRICEDLANILQFDTNIVVDNATSFAGYAEIALGMPFSGNKMVVVWDADTTLGYCMLSGRGLVGNSEGITGGFAHVVLDPSSTIVCRCGSRGCLQSLLSNEALFDYVSRTWNEFPDSPIIKKFYANELRMLDIFIFAREGDAFALNIIDNIVHLFSILIHNIISLYNIQEVVLQGMFALSGNVFLDRLKNNLLNFNNLSLYKNVNVTYSQYSYEQALYGINPYYRGANMYLSDLFINAV